MFCLRILMLPPPSSFFQAKRARLAIHGPKIKIAAFGDVQKMRSRQMMGVEPLKPGRASPDDVLFSRPGEW